MPPCQPSGLWFISSIRGHALQTPIRLKFRGKRFQDVYMGVNHSSTYGGAPSKGMIYQTRPALGWYLFILGYKGWWGCWLYLFLDPNLSPWSPSGCTWKVRSCSQSKWCNSRSQPSESLVGSSQGPIPSIDHLKVLGFMIGSTNTLIRVYYCNYPHWPPTTTTDKGVLMMHGTRAKIGSIRLCYTRSSGRV